MSKNVIRFRKDALGNRVMIAGRWVEADEQVMENIHNLLLKMFK